MDTLARRRRIVFVQTAVPEYRGTFFRELYSRLGDQLQIFASRKGVDGTVNSVEAPDLPIKWIERTTLAGGRLFLTHGITSAVLSADIAVMPLNPRSLSSWHLAVRRRLRNRKVILWGHGWAMGGQKAQTDLLRGMMRKLPHVVVVYTESERQRLSELLPGVPVFATRNALYRQAEMQPDLPSRPPSDIIYVGRFTKSKKPATLVQGFAAAVSNLPPETMLQLVGDGPLRQECEQLASQLGVADRVRFHGHQAELSYLRNLYAHSVCSASPGYLGLSLTQSLGFGIPMVVSRDEPHAPEVEALREGENAIYFDTDSADSLSETLQQVVRNRADWYARRASISDTCRAAYSIEKMVESMLLALEG